MQANRRRALTLRSTLWLLLIAAAITGCDLLSTRGDEGVPTILTAPPSPAASQNLEALVEARPLPRDREALARRLRGVEEIPSAIATGSLTVGDTLPFWYKNHESDESVQIKAQLVYRSDDLHLWLEAGLDVNDEILQEAAQEIEQKILPLNNALFGDEWQAVTNGDPRLNILHLKDIGGNVVGYYSSADEFAPLINPFSNQRNLLYVNSRLAPVGSDDYYEVIAHEMQHMIHWHVDSNEETWMDEGMAVLAERLNGYSLVGFDRAYARSTDVQLTDFDYESQDSLAHYGASYLFSAYFFDRFGRTATRELVRHVENGTDGIEATLASIGKDMDFHELFADWTAATYLAGRDREYDIFRYDSVSVPRVEPAASFRRFPASGQATVHQFGADYIQLSNRRPLTVVFTGTQQVGLLQTAPRSGDYFWTTVPADDSQMQLTRRFDLSGLEQATLSFWSWYEIEEGWDYAYISISADDGQSWHILETDRTTHENPHGTAFGPGLTGVSGPDRVPRWVQQKADLTPYAGVPVIIRFEYVTDDAVHRSGLALDDITIPELGYEDDVEGGAGAWEAIGFARHSNILPQSFLVQRLLIGREGVLVERLPLDENRRGRWRFPLDGQFEEAILIVSGSTPVTTLPASYAYYIYEE